MYGEWGKFFVLFNGKTLATALPQAYTKKYGLGRFFYFVVLLGFRGTFFVKSC